jgi:hypothetical protein
VYVGARQPLPWHECSTGRQSCHRNSALGQSSRDIDCTMQFEGFWPIDMAFGSVGSVGLVIAFVFLWTSGLFAREMHFVCTNMRVLVKNCHTALVCKPTCYGLHKSSGRQVSCGHITASRLGAMNSQINGNVLKMDRFPSRCWSDIGCGVIHGWCQLFHKCGTVVNSIHMCKVVSLP